MAKLCPGSCSNKGICAFMDVNSGKRVSSCFVNDPSCTSFCDCNAGAYGTACQGSGADWLALQSISHQAVVVLKNLTTLDDINAQTLASWSQLLNLLASSPEQMNIAGMREAMTIAEKTIDVAMNHSLMTASIKDALLTAVDYLAGIPVVPDVSKVEINATNHIFTESLNNNSAVNSRGLVAVIRQAASWMQSSLVLGQSDTTNLLNQMRYVIAARQFSSSADGVVANNHSIELKIPSTPSEIVVDYPSTAVRIMGHNDSMTNTVMISNEASFTVSLFQVKAMNYQYKEPLQSNPIIMQIKAPSQSAFSASPSSSEVRQQLQEEEYYLASIIKTVEFSIPLIQEVKKYSDDYISKNFTSFCRGSGDQSVYSYLCLDSGKRLFHNCSSIGRGTYVSYCPQPVPSCHVVQRSSSEREEYVKAPHCQVSNYSTSFVQCICQFSQRVSANLTDLQSERRRRLFTVIGENENTSTVTIFKPIFALSGDQQELVVVTDYTDYRQSADKFLDGSESAEYENRTYVTISIFIPSILLLLFFLQDYRRTRAVILKERNKQKNKMEEKEKKKESEKLTKLMKRSQRSEINTNQITPVLLPTNIEEEEQEEEVSIETFTDRYLHFFDQIIPSIYRTDITHYYSDSLKKLWEEMLQHHRYLSVMKLPFNYWKKETRNAGSEDLSQSLPQLRKMLRLLAGQLFIILMLTVTLNAQSGEGAYVDSCERQSNETLCLHGKSYFDNSIRQCQWKSKYSPVAILRPTTIDPDITHYECVQNDVSELMGLLPMLICVIVAIVSTSIFAVMLERALELFDSRLIPSSLLTSSSALEVSNASKNEKKKKRKKKNKAVSPIKGEKGDVEITAAVAASPTLVPVKTKSVFNLHQYIRANILGLNRDEDKKMAGDVTPLAYPIVAESVTHERTQLGKYLFSQMIHRRAPMTSFSNTEVSKANSHHSSSPRWMLSHPSSTPSRQKNLNRLDDDVAVNTDLLRLIKFDEEGNLLEDRNSDERLGPDNDLSVFSYPQLTENERMKEFIAIIAEERKSMTELIRVTELASSPDHQGEVVEEEELREEEGKVYEAFRKKYFELTRFVNQYEKQWNLHRARRGEGNAEDDVFSASLSSLSFSLSQTSKTVITDEIQTVRKESEEQHSIIQQRSETHKAIALFYLLMQDLLGRDRGGGGVEGVAGMIFKFAFEEVFRQTKAVSRRLLQCMIIGLWAVTIFCLVYSLIIIVQQQVVWQTTLLYSYLITLALDVIIFASLECFLLHYFIPMLAFYPIHSAYEQLRGFLFYAIPEVLVFFKKSVDRQQGGEGTVRLALEDLYVIHNLSSLFPWNACEELYVSHRVAMRCEELFESLLVLSYHDVFPSQHLHHRLQQSQRKEERDRAWKRKRLALTQMLPIATSFTTSSSAAVSPGRPKDEEEDDEEDSSSRSMSRDEDEDDMVDVEGARAGGREEHRRPSHTSTEDVVEAVITSDVISLFNIYKRGVGYGKSSGSVLYEYLLYLFFFLPVSLVLSYLSSSALKSLVTVMVPVHVIAVAVMLFFAADTSAVSEEASLVCFWLLIAGAIVILIVVATWMYCLPLVQRLEIEQQEICHRLITRQVDEPPSLSKLPINPQSVAPSSTSNGRRRIMSTFELKDIHNLLTSLSNLQTINNHLYDEHAFSSSEENSRSSSRTSSPSPPLLVLPSAEEEIDVEEDEESDNEEEDDGGKNDYVIQVNEGTEGLETNLDERDAAKEEEDQDHSREEKKHEGDEVRGNFTYVPQSAESKEVIDEQVPTNPTASSVDNKGIASSGQIARRITVTAVKPSPASTHLFRFSNRETISRDLNQSHLSERRESKHTEDEKKSEEEKTSADDATNFKNSNTSAAVVKEEMLKIEDIVEEEKEWMDNHKEEREEKKEEKFIPTPSVEHLPEMQVIIDKVVGDEDSLNQQSHRRLLDSPPSRNDSDLLLPASETNLLQQFQQFLDEELEPDESTQRQRELSAKIEAMDDKRRLEQDHENKRRRSTVRRKQKKMVMQQMRKQRIENLTINVRELLQENREVLLRNQMMRRQHQEVLQSPGHGSSTVNKLNSWRDYDDHGEEEEEDVDVDEDEKEMV